MQFDNRLSPETLSTSTPAVALVITKQYASRPQCSQGVSDYARVEQLMHNSESTALISVSMPCNGGIIGSGDAGSTSQHLVDSALADSSAMKHMI